jgi:catalase
VTDGADGEVVESLRRACESAGATVMIIAPKVGGVKLEGGRTLAADGQLAGTPSVLFDGVAIVASKAGVAELLGDAAARDFAAHAFAHLKAIAYTEEVQPLLAAAGVDADAFVMPAARRAKAFAASLGTRLWEREPRVRPLP